MRTPRNCFVSFVLVLAAAGFGATAIAATPADKPAAQAAAVAVPLSDGLVKKIDKAGKTVTLSHGPLPGGMPAMTMAYRVKDAAWLDKMKVGQKIRFAPDPADGGMSLLRFEPAQ